MITTTPSYIETDPQTCDGKPRLAGTRIRVQDIALMHRQGATPDSIVAAFDSLTLASVYAALSFYYDNQSVIDNLIESDEALYEKRADEFTSPLNALLIRRKHENSLSS